MCFSWISWEYHGTKYNQVHKSSKGSRLKFIGLIMGFKNLIVYVYIYIYLCVCMVPKIGGPYFLLL